MDINSILARTVSGLAVKAVAVGFAIYAVAQVWTYVAHVFGQVSNALPM